MPDIIRINLKGNENIGLFSSCWEDLLFLPPETKPSIVQQLKETLQIQTIAETTVAETGLLGMFLVVNKAGILVPHTITQTEYETIQDVAKQTGRNLGIIYDTITALGNTILTNDKKAIVSPDINPTTHKTIEETLDVDLIINPLVDSPLVGSVAYTTTIGTLLHPLATHEDIKLIENELKTKVDITTVNRGVPYPHSGIIATTKGAAVGTSTTGPETLRIYQTLFA